MVLRDKRIKFNILSDSKMLDAGFSLYTEDSGLQYWSLFTKLKRPMYLWLRIFMDRKGVIEIVDSEFDNEEIKTDFSDSVIRLVNKILTELKKRGIICL